MPTCIYCRAKTTGNEGVPHVMPQALGPNEITLPRGAECDKCNHYFGRKLEPMLYRYPGIALALQFWGIRGKKGRLRKKLGTVERTEAGYTRFGIHSPQVETDKYGRRTVYMDLPPDPDFDMLEFRAEASFTISRLDRHGELGPRSGSISSEGLARIDDYTTNASSGGFGWSNQGGESRTAVRAAFTLLRGRHAMKFGAEYEANTLDTDIVLSQIVRSSENTYDWTEQFVTARVRNRGRPCMPRMRGR